MDFFEKWFGGFGKGLEGLSREERGRLLAPCAKACAADALRDLYTGLFGECGGDPDMFFGRLCEVTNVDGRVLGKGRVYEMDFLVCGCDLHTEMGVNTPALCECSRQSIMTVLKTLMPGCRFAVEEQETILGGAERCRFRITKEE